MAERSRSADGDRQGDGWGIGGLDDTGVWRGAWSLRPIWEDESVFAEIPAYRLFLVHARSASFPGQKGKLAYNQPFIGESEAFVFNGLLRGVSVARPVAGEIGAQKIWSLFGSLLPHGDNRDRFFALVRALERSSREISALNLGLAAKGGFLAYCRSGTTGEYYRLQAAEASGLRMICSEPLSGGDFRPLREDAIVSL
jgi:predicted glutamine amidotransferase